MLSAAREGPPQGAIGALIASPRYKRFGRTSSLTLTVFVVQGCGFVSFALPEDAERAVKELSGSQLGNRPIQASL